MLLQYLMNSEGYIFSPQIYFNLLIVVLVLIIILIIKHLCESNYN